MKFLLLLPRILLGLGFTLFGVIGLFHIKMPEPTMPADAQTFGQILYNNHYWPFIFACQLVGGILLLLGKVPMGLCFLGPVLVNIVLFHTLLSHGGFLPPAVFVVLFLIVFWQNRKSFEPIFKD